MKFKYAIFDMDGTLLDSMPYWKNLGENYLLSRGFTPPSNLSEVIKAMSMEESSEYFRNEFGLKESREEITAQVNAFIENEYRNVILCKPFVKEYLESLSKMDIKMCVATATSKELAVAALERDGILKYFKDVCSCDEVGKGKRSPDIFYYALKKIDGIKEMTAIFEDAGYAMKTSFEEGFYTVGVFDASCGKSGEEMEKRCHRYIRSFEDLL